MRAKRRPLKSRKASRKTSSPKKRRKSIYEKQMAQYKTRKK